MQTPPTYLAADRVSKVFQGPNGASTAVDGVSFSVPEGSFVSIVGPSGCGKSTILGMIAGLIAPTSGRTVLGERTVTRPPVDMVYLFQQYSKSLLPWRTVSHNIELGLEAPARRRSLTRTQIAERCARYLELVGLSGVEDHYPWQLSGGMQQRVAIARALVCEPKVLLMDEPFSAVDALTRSSLQDLVLSLWEELGITILFVTHDIDEAIFLSDKIYVLTKAPAHIVHALDVELPRPRHQVETRELPRFLEYRRELLARVMS